MFKRSLLALSLTMSFSSIALAEDGLNLSALEKNNQPKKTVAKPAPKASETKKTLQTAKPAVDKKTTTAKTTQTQTKSVAEKSAPTKTANTKTANTNKSTTKPSNSTSNKTETSSKKVVTATATTATVVAKTESLPQASWSLENLNNAEWSEDIGTGQLPIYAKAHVLLNNAYSTPGAIDGSSGPKTDKAIRSFQVIYGLQKTGVLDKPTWDKLVELNGDQPTFVEYTIKAEDTRKDLYVDSIPVDYSQKAKMKALAYTRVTEMLGEKFHMDEGFLKKLNPNAKFVAGEKIIVANVSKKLPENIQLIVAHKGAKQLYLFNRDNQMIASFPATFGNDPTALVGEHKITGVARNPWYSYSPSNFVQGNNLKPLSIPPGPNGPVGNVWIGLSKKTFGIHGTPDPSKISTNNSHGCIRLSNWDANNLANYVKAGVSVRFVD